MSKELNFAGGHDGDGFPAPPFELDLRNMEDQIGEWVDNSCPGVTWSMREHNGEWWTQAERRLAVPSRATEVVVAQVLGPHPNEADNVLYRVEGLGNSLQWPLGTEQLSDVSVGVADSVIDTADFFAQCLADAAPVASHMSPR